MRSPKPIRLPIGSSLGNSERAHDSLTIATAGAFSPSWLVKSAPAGVKFHNPKVLRAGEVRIDDRRFGLVRQRPALHLDAILLR